MLVTYPQEINYAMLSTPQTQNLHGPWFARLIPITFGVFREQNLSCTFKSLYHGVLGELQAGFRSGRRIEDNLFVLTQCVEIAQQAQRPLYVSFLDIAKAYDLC